MSDYTYVILPTADVTQAIIDVCVQTSMDTLRKSLDGTEAVLKYLGDKPSILDPYTDYTHAEIIPIMCNSEWSDPDA